MRMKGQMYLIMAIIIIVLLTLIKISLNLTDIIENKKAMEINLERQEFQNVRDEVVKIPILTHRQNNITDNTESFIRFAHDALEARTIDLEGVFVISSYPKVSSNTDTKLNVTFFNFLDDDVEFLNLTFNTTVTTATDVEELERLDRQFDFRISSPTNLTLTVFYNTSSINNTEEITITTEVGKSRFFGFYDLRYVSSKLEQRDKFVQVIDLP